MGDIYYCRVLFCSFFRFSPPPIQDRRPRTGRIQKLGMVYCIHVPGRAGRSERNCAAPGSKLWHLALILSLSWVLAGWRAALLAILSLIGMLALGKWLGRVIGRLRPSPELVRVFCPFSGYGFPSLFALRYAATFGFLAVLAAIKNSGVLRTVTLIACGALLNLGFVARVALAAHWPSHVIVSFLIGFLWASPLARFAGGE